MDDPDLFILKTSDNLPDRFKQIMEDEFIKAVRPYQKEILAKIIRESAELIINGKTLPP